MLPDATAKDRLVDSARRWANIADLARRQLEMAVADPVRDPDAVAALTMVAGTVQKVASGRLRLLAMHDLDRVAENIRTTTATAEGPLAVTAAIPPALRLAEADLESTAPEEAPA